MFDRAIAVDWSARSLPSPKRPTRDAIFVADIAYNTPPKSPIYCRTRQMAFDVICTKLEQALHLGQSVFLGFDFAFGYPIGFIPKITDENNAKSFWSWLSDHVQDDDKNANNRFEIAALLNRKCTGIGPFWGCPAQTHIEGLPHKGRVCHGHGLNQFRMCELSLSAQSVWKLYTVGSVGSQSLLGLPYIHKLIEIFDGNVSVWPFDEKSLEGRSPIVIGEIYPSLWKDGTDEYISVENVYEPNVFQIKDAKQVQIAAYHILQASHTQWFQSYLAPSVDPVLLSQEGWIFGHPMKGI